MAKKWVKVWDKLPCSQITQEIAQKFVLEMRNISAYTDNKNIKDLRATFNFGKKRKLISNNPLDGIEFFPEEKKVKYVPHPEDIDKVITFANQDTQDYLWTIRETMGRMSEINRLRWEDVNLEMRFVILYTRKKRGGHLTPRKIPMTNKLYEILSSRFLLRDSTKPWVFWHRYWSRRTNKMEEGPYKDRKRIMKALCKKAGVRYFRFHAIRHSGASVMDNHNAPVGSIQRILGHEYRTTTESVSAQHR